MASGDVLARRESSLGAADLGTMPFGRPRKPSRSVSSMSLLSGGSTNLLQNGQATPRRQSRRFSQFPAGGSKVVPESSRLSSESSNKTPLPTLTEHRRMNLSDVVIWRRLTRTLQQRVADRRSERRTFCWLGRSTSSRSGNDVPEVQMEPTYKMEPDRKFKARECEILMKKYLSETLENAAYNSQTCRDLSTKMSDEIKIRIKSARLLPPRYKCVVYVVLGEKKDQGVSVSSESAWDKKTDNFVSVSFQNSSLFCAVTLFAVYME